MLIRRPGSLNIYRLLMFETNAHSNAVALQKIKKKKKKTREKNISQFDMTPPLKICFIYFYLKTKIFLRLCLYF